MYRVLFVCTGNICRSPTAEGVFRHQVREAGLEHAIATDSVGLGGWHVGDPPDSRAVGAARRRGIDLGDIRARQITADDFTDFDLLLAMDRGHYRDLSRRCPPDRTDRVRMFLEAARGGAAPGETAPDETAPGEAAPDVPDPYYGAAADFEHALDLIEAGARGWIERLRADLA
jgi:protein-tyrosine phosphatase